MMLAYAGIVGIVNALCGTNYMYLCRKPKNASPLDAFGGWTLYLVPAAASGLVLSWLLWLPARRAQVIDSSRSRFPVAT